MSYYAPIDDLSLLQALNKRKNPSQVVIPNLKEQYDQNLIYKGRKAKFVPFQTNGIELNPKTEYSNPINFEETGELLGFTISCNNPNVKIICFIYDEDNNAYTIQDRTMHQTTLLGRGMTTSEAYETRPDGTSVDQKGERHPIYPYIVRFKHTFTDLSKTYEEVKGTENDKHIVLDYSPDLQHNYSSIYFNIQNPSTEHAVIHYVVLTRIVYIDIYQEQNTTKKMEILASQLRAGNPLNTVAKAIEF